MNKYREAIHNNIDELISFRHELHRHPEPSLKEFETTERICRELDKVGITYRKMQPTGISGDIRGTKGDSDHIVLIRSDMDALEVLEQTGLDFASENVGYMHACGHDNHMTCLLGAVKYLNAHKEEFNGTVRFVFQPAEEVAAGSKLMIEQGVMENVDRAVGMHISPIFPLGQISAMEGECWAACDRFKITVHGKSSHGATPHVGRDALLCASAIVLNLQPIISREADPNTAAVVTVGSILSGSRFNIVAGDAVMEGTSRTFSREFHKELPEKMRRVIEHTAMAYDCTAELDFEVLTDVLYCDPETTKIGLASAAKVVGEDMSVSCGPQMVAEDFCFYTNHAKSVFFNLGARVEDDSKVFPLHSDHAVFDDRALEVGASVFVQTAVDLLDSLA